MISKSHKLKGSAVATLPESLPKAQSGLKPAADLLPLVHREPADVLYHSMADRERLQRVVKTAQRITGCPLPSLMDIYTSHCLSRAKTITKDSSHPDFDLFDLSPSVRRYRCIRTKTNRLKNSFFPKAITTLNSHMHWFLSLTPSTPGLLLPTHCAIFRYLIFDVQQHLKIPWKPFTVQYLYIKISVQYHNTNCIFLCTSSFYVAHIFALLMLIYIYIFIYVHFLPTCLHWMRSCFQSHCTVYSDNNGILFYLYTGWCWMLCIDSLANKSKGYPACVNTITDKKQFITLSVAILADCSCLWRHED